MLENLKELIYHDCKYNFIYSDFEFSFTSTSLFGEKAIEEDIYNAYFFLSPYHLSEVLVGIKVKEKTWDIELSVHKKSALPLIDSYQFKKGLNPTDFEIENDFSGLLNSFNRTLFFKEPTLSEAIGELESLFSELLSKKDVSYIAGSFSDKLMEQLTKEFDFNHPSLNTMMLNDKEKGIFYKKMNTKLIGKDNQIIHKTKKI